MYCNPRGHPTLTNILAAEEFKNHTRTSLPAGLQRGDKVVWSGERYSDKDGVIEYGDEGIVIGPSTKADDVGDCARVFANQWQVDHPNILSNRESAREHWWVLRPEGGRFGAPILFSLGGTLLPSIYADARAILMPSSFQRPHFSNGERVDG